MAIAFLDLTAQHAEIAAELDAAFRRVVARSQYILGPELEAFEAEFAAYCGVEHCIGVGSGYDALELVLRAAGIGGGDEVIVPGTTFAASWFAVSRTGATPVPVEVSDASVTLDPNLIEAAITPRTRAIMPVHLYGHPAEMDAIRAVAERHGLFVLEDAAQAHGTVYRGRSAGALGNAAAFSFYPGKNLGALGDAGAVVTGDAQIAARMRRLRNYGSDRKYVHEEIAGNSRLDEMQAAFLRVKLRHLDRWNAVRQAAAAIHRETCRPAGHRVAVDRRRLRAQLAPLRRARARSRSRASAAQGARHRHARALSYPVPPAGRVRRTHHGRSRADRAHRGRRAESADGPAPSRPRRRRRVRRARRRGTRRESGGKFAPVKVLFAVVPVYYTVIARAARRTWGANSATLAGLQYVSGAKDVLTSGLKRKSPF
jgi:dTDP-4-amino-4,6-dideoxygalactose transaminase